MSAATIEHLDNVVDLAERRAAKNAAADYAAGRAAAFEEYRKAVDKDVDYLVSHLLRINEDVARYKNRDYALGFYGGVRHCITL